MALRVKIAIALLAVLLPGAVFLRNAALEPPDGRRREALVIQSQTGRTHRFEVEIAATPEELEAGLMFRARMAPDHGMLFELHRTDVTRFWMKNTLIPLDMLFISADGTIRKIHGSAVPESLATVSSDAPVSGVLELNGGRAKELGIAAGDTVVHPYFEAK